MKLSKPYQLKKIGKSLKTGKAWIEGETCDGNRWPEGNHYWIIQDGENMQTHHVLVSDRPRWAKYNII